MAGKGSAAWVDVLPNMAKVAGNMVKGTTSAAKTAGAAAGRQFSSSMAAGAKGGAGASTLVQELERAAKKASKVVSTEKAAITRAREAERAATQQVTAAESALEQRRSIAAAAAKGTSAAEANLTAKRAAMATAIQFAAREETMLNAARASGNTAEAARLETSLAAARVRAQTASQAVIKAEAGIETARARELAASSRISSAEAALTTSRSRSATAAAKFATQEDILKTAINEQKIATKQLADAQTASSKRAQALALRLDEGTSSADRSDGVFRRAAKGVRGFAGGIAATVKPLAGMAAGFALIIGAGNVITLGNEYTATMNELGAVTNATSSQMSAFRASSRALGSDLELPATSGKDAAAVMLELAKGGFTAQGAIDAARGTILLAAAAQVDGAQAAEIQSNAINQFGLSAKDASRVADVLANTANAASGGITDIATSMKYVGPVAKALGINIEDTSTSIGLLANAGLKGDTAGTALRGMLASLARPSKQAQKGVDALNLSVFDSQGNFVGMRSVVEQLSQAQKSMSKEAFAANAVLAFGREPLAAVTSLAAEGTKGYDGMAKAVGRAGGAAAVANSKMQGLGGAMDKLQSQLEDVALGIYDEVSPFLTGAVNSIAGFLDGASGKVSKFLGVAGGLGKLAATGVAGPKLSGLDPAVVAGIQRGRTIILQAFADIRDFVTGSLIPSLRALSPYLGDVARIVGTVLVGGFRLAAGALKLIGPPLLATAKWLGENKTLVESLAISIGVLVGAYKLQVAILSAGSLVKWLTGMKLVIGAQKVWNGVQLAWNVIASANPIGIIIVAIAALVAGLVWAYNNSKTFRDIVQGALAAVGAAARWLGDVFVWLWTNAIKPAIDGIVTGALWLWNSVLKPTFDGIMAAVRFVGAVFTWWWRNIVMPVANGIATAISYVWNNYLSPIFQLVGAIIRTVVAPAFAWLWSSVIQPVVGWIVGAVQWWWSTTKANFTAAVSFVRGVLGTAFTWLYTSIVKPVFDWIVGAVVWWWTTTKSNFTAAVSFLRSVLGPVFTWLRDTIVRPVFDGISRTISTVWKSGIKPVFDTISNFAKKTIPDAFTKMKDAVGTAWDAIKTSAKTPIKFVVNTVINDGIIKNFNKVAGFFGTKKMPEVALPKGFSDGGYTGPGGKFQPAGVVHAGEYVLTKEETSRLGVGRIRAFAESGMPGYAGGGLVGAATGAWDWIAGKAGKAWDWAKNTAETAQSVVSDPVGTLGKLVKGIIGKIPGAENVVQTAAGMGSKILNSAIEKLKGIGTSTAGSFGGNGQNGRIPSSALGKANGFAPGPGVGATGGLLRKAAAAAWNAASAASGGILRLTEGYRDLKAQQYRWGLFQHGGNLAAVPGTSKHGLGLAADVAGGQSWLRANGRRYGWVNTGLGFSQREPWHFEYSGAARPAAGPNATLYDAGGQLPVGTSLVANKTGKPEAVLTNEDYRLLRERAHESSGGDTIVHATVGGTGNHHEDIRDVRRAVNDRRHGGRGRKSR